MKKRLNIQLLSETKTYTQEEVDKMLEGKFTQEKVNEIVVDRLKRASEKYPSEEEMKLYNDWKENQKTNEEKNNELIEKFKSESETSKKEVEDYKKEIQNLKNQNLVAKHNPIDSEYVLYKVGKLVTDEKDFETCLKELKENEPSLFVSEKKKITKKFNEDDANEDELGFEKILREKGKLK